MPAHPFAPDEFSSSLDKQPYTRQNSTNLNGRFYSGSKPDAVLPDSNRLNGQFSTVRPHYLNHRSVSDKISLPGRVAQLVRHHLDMVGSLVRVNRAYHQGSYYK